MVYRIYTEKKKGYRNEAQALSRELSAEAKISTEEVRILCRYDVEGVSEELFERAVTEIFSEPAVDDVREELPSGYTTFAVSYLPGQFDQRAESARECLAFLSPGTDARVKSAKVYLLRGVSDEDAERIKKLVINPVEAGEDSLSLPETLETVHPIPSRIPILEGFTGYDEAELEAVLTRYGLAMDLEDLKVFQQYFKEEGREPTLTELRVCDTYWSDHCRHTTFLTSLDEVKFEDPQAEEMFRIYLEIRRETGREGSANLMDVATIGARYLGMKGLLPEIDKSEEINACSIKVKVKIDGEEVPYLLMFKNETHNHPTEIEPFGGAATCIGGAIRDPLSGRAYVYQAMRITGSGDVTKSLSQTLEGKLSQRKIGITSAAGYSSYGNQIGLATGEVAELYHEGYEAKHMELGAVVAAVREANVRRETPEDGDVVILLGGRTGRDGIGGATGSSKSHDSHSGATCAAEVQKGNAPEERKLQRLFRNPEAARLIRRCNDFGAGGVSVAIGELSAGLEIDLDKVPRKYQGLDGTEIAISESQERMAVVVKATDAEHFITLAKEENLEATIVATVTAEPILRMKWRGDEIVSLRRSFLDTNGAEKHTKAFVKQPEETKRERRDLPSALSSLAECSREGLSERFDSTIGAGTVLMPFGGRYQKTPAKAMCALIPIEDGYSETASLFAYGAHPGEAEADPFQGGYDAVITALSKLVAAGGSHKGAYLTAQEYFGKCTTPERWGRPLAALLGVLKAQLETGCAAIGGKDSMSGSFNDLNVPNTLVCFAICTISPDAVISPEFKETGSCISVLRQEGGIEEHLLKAEEIFKDKENILSVSLSDTGDGMAEIARMCFGNMIGARTDLEELSLGKADFIIESKRAVEGATLIGYTSAEPRLNGYSLEELLSAYEARLEGVYPQYVEEKRSTETITSSRKWEGATVHPRKLKPHVLIPVFPGTNCEYDSERAWKRAGAEAESIVIRNLDEKLLRDSILAFASRLEDSDILFIPGGFSGGDEPDGSAKFITCFLKNPEIRDGIEELLEKRKGLVGGICNGFQALIKLGLVPYGEFREMKSDSPTLSFNTIARHQSKLVRTRISSTSSPWLSCYDAGDIQLVPISHGEGRFIATAEEIANLVKRGQVATQYADLEGNASMDIRYNPNGSAEAIEGITSPDGRVFGRMGHIERCHPSLYRNVGRGDSLPFFRGAVSYFS